MDYEEMIAEMYEDDAEFERYYGKLSPAQQAVVDEIIMRHELTEDEFQDLIDDPIYYKGDES